MISRRQFLKRIALAACTAATGSISNRRPARAELTLKLKRTRKAEEFLQRVRSDYMIFGNAFVGFDEAKGPDEAIITRNSLNPDGSFRPLDSIKLGDFYEFDVPEYEGLIRARAYTIPDDLFGHEVVTDTI